MKITEMFAFVSVDANGDEGVVAMTSPLGMMLPLIGADMARVESLKLHAIKIAEVTGIPVILLKFSVREEIGWMP
ncbi:hypothetical protein LCGC14_2516530 [marine sediment metagenome]|uniref:Uncharacterized protein n=1 Tax=marine sediment metagenome TaxID=412755 RepID=A0A0F9DR16_9ZZZZ